MLTVNLTLNLHRNSYKRAFGRGGVTNSHRLRELVIVKKTATRKCEHETLTALSVPFVSFGCHLSNVNKYSASHVQTKYQHDSAEIQQLVLNKLFDV